MGYSANADLQDLFDPKPLERSAARITKRVTKEIITKGASRRTPVAKVPEGMTPSQFSGRRGRVPGRMKASWYDTPVEHVKGANGNDLYRADSLTDDPEAPHVEYPTRPHVIRPRADRAPASVIASGKPRLPGTDPNARLLFWMGGRRVYAREVHHPGTSGVHMMRDSLAEADGTWIERVGNEELERWVKEQARLVT